MRGSKAVSAVRGFTLVELLVVITIIGILMGLLLPAVNMAREAARNNTCKNNQKQLSLAALQYDGTYNRMPGYKNPGGSGSNTYGWVVPVLPFMERRDLVDSSGVPTGATVDLLICASDPPEVSGAKSTSYVGNAGLADNNNEKPANGVFVDRSSAGTTLVSIDYIGTNDGTSNTLMLSENVQCRVRRNWHAANPSKEHAGFCWYASPGSDPKRKINGTAAGKIIALATEALDLNTARPSSYHPGGVNVAFCDGHIKFISETVDYNIYKQLMTPESAASDDPTKILLDDSKY